MKDIANTLILSMRTLVFGLMFLMPIIFIPASWSTIPHAKMLIVATFSVAALVLWIASKFLKKFVILPISFIAFSALLLPVVYATSAFVTGLGSHSLVGVGVEKDTVVAMILWFVSLLVTMLALTSKKMLIKAIKIILYAVLFAILFHFIGFLVNFANIFGGTLAFPNSSLVGSWHDFAILLGLSSILSTIFFFREEKNKFERNVSVAVYALSLIFLIFINSKDVWGVLFIISFVLFGYLIFDMFLKKSVSDSTYLDTESPARFSMSSLDIRVWILVVLLAVSGSMYFFGDFVHNRLPTGVRISELDIRPSWEGTLNVGTAVYEERGFLFGSGPNSFTRQWVLYKPSEVNNTAFWNTDFQSGIGFIPTSLVTVGVFGAFAWLLFFVILGYSGFRSVFFGLTTDKHWKWVLLILFISVVYLWIFNIVYPPGITLLVFTFMLTGVFIAGQNVLGMLKSVRISFDSGIWRALLYIIVSLLIGLVALSAGFVSTKALVADMLVNKSIVVFNKTNDFNKAQKILSLSKSFDSSNGKAYRAATELGILKLIQTSKDDQNDDKNKDKLKAVLEETIKSGLAAVSVNGADYQNWLTLARLYQQLAGGKIEGAYENARKAYERAAVENPTSPIPYFQLAQLDLSQNDVESAKANLSEALARKNNYATALYLLTQIAISEKNTKDAMRFARATTKAAPREPIAWYQLGALNYGAGNYEKSAKALENAVILNQNYANALYILGLSYQKLNRLNDALVVLKKVKALNPKNELIDKTISSINSSINLKNKQKGVATPTNER